MKTNNVSVVIQRQVFSEASSSLSSCRLQECLELLIDDQRDF